MRQNLEAARDAGVNLASSAPTTCTGASASSRPRPGRCATRSTTATPHATPQRRRSAARHHQLPRGPAANPESSLIGNYYECNPVDADWVVGDPTMWMFEGSGFTKGERVPAWSATSTTGSRRGADTGEHPGARPLAGRLQGLKSYADSTWYSAPSGAGVFSAARSAGRPSSTSTAARPAHEQRCKSPR